MRIRKLEDLNPDDFKRVMTGYTSTRKYTVEKTENPEQTTITMQLATLTEPYVKIFPQLPDEMKRYQEIAKQGTSFGAYDGERLVGLAIAEPRDWNRSLWVWELGVEREHRRSGIGASLIKELTRVAEELNLRIIVCETQNTNVPAIEFYKATGFEIDGIDLSYYPNTGATAGEVAIFMKKKLG
jgi:ribosomal protein S18 acetylase RimI-like enzyme